MPVVSHEPCPKCAPHGGMWMETPEGLARCDCPRGRELRRLGEPRSVRTPVISTECATMCAGMLAALPYFPSAEMAKTAIGDSLRRMCVSEESALELVDRAVEVFREWPGILEMRLLYCSMERPLDGFEPTCCSVYFPEGDYPTRKRVDEALKRLAAVEDIRQLGLPIDADQLLAVREESMELVSRAFRRGFNRIPVPLDTPVVELTSENRITPEKVQAALDELHAKKEAERDAMAREELGDSEALAG